MFLKLITLFLTHFALANAVTTQTWNSFDDFSKGHFENVILLSSGQLEVGYAVKTLSLDLPSTVTAMTVNSQGQIYVATSGPGQVWQIKSAEKPRLIFESEQPLITQLVSMPNGDLAVLTGPEGGVAFIKPSSPKTTRFFPIAQQPLGAYLQDNSLMVVGNSNTLFSIKNYQLTQTTTTPLETQLRSIYKNYLGSGLTGTIYQNNKAVFKASGETVALVEDSQKNLLAAFNTSPTSSQIWKISSKEPSCLVWESSRNLIFSLALNQSKLFWGTGPNGQLFSSKPECKAKPDILLSLENKTRIMSIVPQGSKLLIATAKSGSVLELDLSQRANLGRFIGPIIKLDIPSKITEASALLRVGNTPIPDASWSDFEKDKNRQVQFVEPRILVKAGKPVSEASFSYIN